MSSMIGDNKPPEQFWKGLEEIVGERALESYDRSSLTQTDVSRLVKGIGAKPEEVRLAMAKYILENCSLNSGAFNQLIGLIGWVEPRDEPALVEAILAHKHFDEEYIWEIHNRSGWMENEALRATVENLGIDVSLADLRAGVQSVIAAQQPGRFFD
jgi:hypothetical protein